MAFNSVFLRSKFDLDSTGGTVVPELKSAIDVLCEIILFDRLKGVVGAQLAQEWREWIDRYAKQTSGISWYGVNNVPSSYWANAVSYFNALKEPTTELESEAVLNAIKNDQWYAVPPSIKLKLVEANPTIVTRPNFFMLPLFNTASPMVAQYVGILSHDVTATVETPISIAVKTIKDKYGAVDIANQSIADIVSLGVAKDMAAFLGYTPVPQAVTLKEQIATIQQTAKQNLAELSQQTKKAIEEEKEHSKSIIESRLKTADTTVNTMRMKLDTDTIIMTTKLADLTQQFNTQEKLYKAKIQELQENMRSKEESYQNAQQSLTNASAIMQSNLTEYKISYEALRTNVSAQQQKSQAAFDEELTKARAMSDEYLAKLNQVKTELDTVLANSAKTERANAEELRKMQRQLELFDRDKNKQLGELKHNLSQTELSLKYMQENYDAAEKKVKSLEGIESSLKQKINNQAAVILKLNKSVEDTQATVATATGDQLAIAKTAAEEAERQAADFRDAYNVTNTKLKETIQQLNDQKKVLEQTQSQITQLQSSGTTASAQYEQQFKETVDQYNTLVANYNALSQENAKLKAEASLVNDQIAQIQKEAAEYKTQMESLRESWSGEQVRTAQAQREREIVNQHVEEMNKTVSELKTKQAAIATAVKQESAPMIAPYQTALEQAQLKSSAATAAVPVMTTHVPDAKVLKREGNRDFYSANLPDAVKSQLRVTYSSAGKPFPKFI